MLAPHQLPPESSQRQRQRQQQKQPKVAVIGLGAQGLVAVKNLVEAGFDVVGFDKNDYVGGIWHYSAEAKLSALPSTVVNVSKERACYTDFPFADDCPSFPDAATMDAYLNAYVDHFELWPYFRLNTTIQSVHRDEERNGWVIEASSKTGLDVERLAFDKLVIAAGPHDKPIYPHIENHHSFAGTITHAISFKQASVYNNKRVIVIGASNSAADTCTSLAGSASAVYFAHRNGAIILPRVLKNGIPLDHKVTYRHGVTNEWLSAHFLGVSQWLGDKYVERISRIEYGQLAPEWRITPSPSLLHQVPTISDTLIPLLRNGQIISCHIPLRVVGPHTIQLQDGSEIEADTIICCTGYSPNLAFLGPADPTLRSDGTYDDTAPEVYQNIFSLRYPDSLAFIGYATMSQPAALLSDLASMAVAQLWSVHSNSPTLPSNQEMNDWYQRHLSWVINVKRYDPQRKIIKFSVQSGPWMSWVDETIGSQIDEHLGYMNRSGWQFWLKDRRLCKLLMGGIWSPHLYRLFVSKRRKSWDGARVAIERANDRRGCATASMKH